MTRLLTIALALEMIVLTGLDIVTTHYALLQGAREGNPLATGALLSVGEPALYLFKLVVVGVACTIMVKRQMWVLLCLFNLMMIGVVLNNVSHL